MCAREKPHTSPWHRGEVLTVGEHKERPATTTKWKYTSENGAERDGMGVKERMRE